jgi:hypothetical protein
MRARYFVGALAAVLSTLSVGMPGSAYGGPAPNRCPELMSRDYSAPMREFPAVRGVPEEGSFGFGPPRMRIASLSGPLQAGAGMVGFDLGFYRRPPLERRLRWEVGLRVIRLSGRGAELGTFAKRHVDLNLAQETGREIVDLSTRVSGRPGFYRLDLSIHNQRGVTLGRYSEYVRVVVRTVDVRFVLGAHRFHPGDAVTGRVQNRGTANIGYMPKTKTLEALGPSGWRKVPEEPVWSAPVGVIGLLPGGDVSSCTGLMLPPLLAAGRYRLSLLVSTDRRTFALRSGFRVE